jgi:hypothetical protein
MVVEMDDRRAVAAGAEDLGESAGFDGAAEGFGINLRFAPGHKIVVRQCANVEVRQNDSGSLLASRSFA